MNSGRPVTAEYLRHIPLPQPDQRGDKSNRGTILVIAGSTEVPGAALLAATGALRAGAGRLQIATTAGIAQHLGLAIPEARVTGFPETEHGGIDPGSADLLAERAARCDAVLIGPGMMDEPAVAELSAALLAATADLPVVLDAAALTGLGDKPELFRRHAGRTVLTPHAGEMARFLGTTMEDVAADPLAAGRQAAQITRGVVAMKGPSTFIVSPQGEAWFCSHGTVGLATSGSGDTLAGIIAGLLARGATPVDATIWGVYLHSEAGNRLARSRGPLGYLARELLAEIPGIMAEFAEGRGG